MKRLCWFLILFTASFAQTAGPNAPAMQSAANPVGELLRHIYPVVQKLLSFISDPDSNANGLKAILKMIDHVASVLMPVPAIPLIRQDTWWGDERGTIDESIRPFRVQFSDLMIDDLRTRIHFRRNFTPPIKGVNNTYGMNSEFLTQILDYWQFNYDFKGREAYLNRYPQFVTNVQGLDIHYLHVRPLNPNKRVVTILLLHGAPLTLFEYNYVIDCLLTPRADVDFVFEIIAPDLPGHGYSQPTYKPGLNGYQVGVIMKNLMRRLGHEQFYVHAGDVGAWVATSMAIMYPEDVLGLHSNLAFSALPQTLVKYALGQLYPPAVVEPERQDRMYPLTAQLRFLLENTGYLHMHATRPDTFGIGADATPAGLAAWILPLMILGSHGRGANNFLFDGNLNRNYNIDDIMDSLTIYWDQHCMTTSARFYREHIAGSDPLVRIINRIPVQVPFAAIKFYDEIIYQPDSFVKDKYPSLVGSIYSRRGGHYAGLEMPRELSESIWYSVPKFESFNAEKRRRGEK